MKDLKLWIIAISLTSIFSCKSGQDSLIGYYEGQLEHNGQTFTMGMEFIMDSTQLSANVVFPEYGWLFPVSNPQFQDTVIVTATINIHYNKNESTVSGFLPPGMVPGYKIPFNLRKTEVRAPFLENHHVKSTRQPESNKAINEKIWAGLVADESSIFVGTLKGNYYSLNSADLETNWTYECGGEIRGPSLIKDGFSYVYSDNGMMHKIDMQGNPVWKFDSQLDSLERNAQNYDFYTALPAYHEGSLYFGNGDGKLVVLNEINGIELQTYEADGPIRATPIFDSGNIIYTSFNGIIENRRVDSDFRNYTINQGVAISGGPILYNDKLIFGNRRYDLTAIDKSGGEVVWKFYYWMSWIESTPIVYDEKIYVGSSDAQMVHSINPETGELIWKFDSGGCPWSSPLATDEFVFTATVGSENYFVKHFAYLICLDRETGQEVWRFSIEPEEEGYYGFAGSPILFDGKVWAAATNGTIYSFSL